MADEYKIREYIVCEKITFPFAIVQKVVGELVRCKHCKWYDISHPYGTVIPDAYYCKMNDRFYDREHFCAYGEGED